MAHMKIAAPFLRIPLDGLYRTATATSDYHGCQGTCNPKP